MFALARGGENNFANTLGTLDVVPAQLPRFATHRYYQSTDGIVDTVIGGS